MQIPGSAIIVSLPQSSKNGYPASIVSPPVDSRFETNCLALFESIFPASEVNPAVSSSCFLSAFVCSMIVCALFFDGSIS